MSRRKMIRYAAGGALVVVLVALLLQAALHWQVGRKLDQSLESVSAFVHFKYADLDTSPLGRIELRGVEFAPRQAMSHPLQVDRLAIEVKSMFYFWGMVLGRDLQSPPQALTAEMSGMEIPLAASWLVSQRAASGAGATLRNPGCPSLFALELQDFRSLGYQRLLADARLNMQSDDKARSLEVGADWRIADLADATVHAAVRLTSSIAAGEAVLPAFDRLEWTFADRGLMDRLKKHCAKSRVAGNDQAFAQVQTRQAVSLYRQETRAEPGSAIRQALLDFFAAPQSLGVVVRPEEVEWSLLHLYRPEELPEVLGLQLTVNGSVVEGLEFAVEPPAQVAQRSSTSLPIPGFLGQEPSPQDSQPTRETADRELRYRPVTAAQLGEHIGRHARIHTVDQKLRTGILKSMQDGTLLLERRLQGGSMSVQVELDQVQRIEVYTR